MTDEEREALRPYVETAGKVIQRHVEASMKPYRPSGVPTCRDFDEDCDAVADKVHCYLYDPAKGFCPYLRTDT